MIFETGSRDVYDVFIISSTAENNKARLVKLIPKLQFSDNSQVIPSPLVIYSKGCLLLCKDAMQLQCWVRSVPLYSFALSVTIIAFVFCNIFFLNFFFSVTVYFFPPFLFLLVIIIIALLQPYFAFI